VHGKLCPLLKLLNTSVDLKKFFFSYIVAERGTGPQIPQHVRADSGIVQVEAVNGREAIA
jgi:hypothetical protein